MNRFPDLRDAKIEENVLDKLQCHTNLEILRIDYYGGTRSPMAVKLHGCHKCILLPSSMKLPSLKHLTINGCSAMNQFRSLETLEICDMAEWEEWEVVVEEFPYLEKLTIRGCPQAEELRVIPRLVPSLQELRIKDHEKLAVLHRIPSIQNLSLITCCQLTTLSDNSQHPSSFYISSTVLPSLVELVMHSCEELSFLLMLPSIKTLELKLTQCNEMVLEKMSDLSSLSSIYMEGISNLSSLPNGFFQYLKALQQLEAHDFRELMMMRLVIYKCPKLVSLTDNEDEEKEGDQGQLLPPDLKYLDISYCDNLKKLPKSLSKLSYLREVIIEGATGLKGLPKDRPSLVSLAEMKLPIGLQILHFRNCSNLESLPNELHSLWSLIELHIMECPALKSFPDMGLPSLNSPSKPLYKLTNLRRLEIEECSFVTECKNLESLQNLTSLLYLSIVVHSKGSASHQSQGVSHHDCPILEFLHGGLSDLTSLTKLYIGNCPILEQRFQKKEGEEWFNITHYTEVYIDGYLQ
ncbi:hypothetical protein NE237_024067 [Protea cynaroides]|uniref:R13L1/DRL21-like LRR repeat region domain-containing protein n=1 Tax=Protea cynaroides TaxID=273540 RepID=A0A9Q0K6W6_9MAGN|nr:hypothetical protein NE237_024067 [Protea cynaroides]